MAEPSPKVMPLGTLKTNVSDAPPWMVRVSPFPRLKLPGTLITLSPPLPLTVVEDVMLLNVWVALSPDAELDRLVTVAFRADSEPVVVPPIKPLPPSTTDWAVGSANNVEFNQA